MGKRRIKKWQALAIALSSALLLWYLFCLPRNLFPDAEYSTVVTDYNGELLGARIAKDGQWRFRMEKDDAGREKYYTALIEFEDRWFRWHPGVNPVSICNALISNIKAGHIVSGGSTISMQVIRMSRNRERSLKQKLVEAILATRLELRYSKDEILHLYAGNAPFGGNVIGLDAAAWRYFGRPADELSWSEAATLSVLPNSPSNIRVEKNRDRLRAKRNRLLSKLLKRGHISQNEYMDACEEPLPDKPESLPSYSSQLTDDLANNQYRNGLNFNVILSINGDSAKAGDKTAGKTIHTSIELNLQRKLEEILQRRSGELALEGIQDMAAVVMEVESGRVLAYCGNAGRERKRGGVNVNVARSPRSSGSILKPFLYCDALSDGIILPYSLVADTPVNINGFAPQNYNREYEGAVPAADALTRSLNVPCVHILKDYGVARFLDGLKERGLTTFRRSADDYGLSLILGGGECRLDEVTAAYAAMARTCVHGEDDATALYYTLDALKDVNRPDEIDWHLIRSVKKVAWKTGTSYGYRDAWAVGVTPSYAVGVWAGNASGAGAQGLVGARTAGPVMFEIFNTLPSSSAEWFPEAEDGVRAEVCKKSGFLAGPYCTEKDTVTLPEAALHSRICPYHFRENGEDVFRLTPAMEWFYRRKHPEYETFAGYGKNESSGFSDSPMEFIYPENGSVISLPKQLDGSLGEIVLNLAHHDRNTTVYWHLDREYIGETRFIHQKRVLPAKGKHSITVTDNHGDSITVSITVI